MMTKNKAQMMTKNKAQMMTKNKAQMMTKTVTLQGPDDEGRWFLANDDGQSVPLVNCFEDHCHAASLFGFDFNDQEKITVRNCYAALEYLLEHNGDQIQCPKFLTYFVNGKFKNETIDENSFA